MKKIIKSILAVVFSVTVLGLSSCTNALANDGDNIVSYVRGGSGAGGAVPFHMYNDKMDLQIWEGTCSISPTGSELIVTPTGTGWWGFGVCSNASDAQSIYDLSKVAKCTYEAKGNNAAIKMYATICATKQNEVTLTDEYAEYSFDTTGTCDEYKNGERTGKTVDVAQNNAQFIVTFGFASGSSDNSFYIKNIKFFDASGNEIVPKINK